MDRVMARLIRANWRQDIEKERRGGALEWLLGE